MSLRRLCAAAVVLALSCLLAGCMSMPQRASGEFVERSIDVVGTRHDYQVFVPATRAGERKPAVIVFLHGSGERGSDNQKQTQVGIGAYVRAHLDDFPAIVVFPQAPEDTEWSQDADMVFAQLDAATREFGGDVDRTSLTGLSMGGFGTWDLALRAPDRFAALVPVCGGLIQPERPSMNVGGLASGPAAYTTVAQRLRDMPVRMFHGAKDDVVLPADDRKLIAAFHAAGAPDAQYTEFPEANHNSWDDTYLRTPSLWTWLFAQHR